MASTQTITVSQQTLEKMYQHYSHQIIKLPQHTLFQAKTKSCTITAYLSKKVVFQGENPSIESSKWSVVVGNTPTTKGTSSSKASTYTKSTSKTKLLGASLPSNIATLSAVGCDEVGTGDYLGPIVICCAYVDDALITKLHQMGIKDSKELHDSQICELATQLKTMIPYQCMVLPNEKYNAMNENGMNANSIKAFMHNKALTLLTPQLQPYPEYLIMDEFVNGPKYFDYLKKLPSKPSIIEKNLYFIQKGESIHVAVAAASIIARAAFVDYMDQLSKDFNQIIPKGASSQVDEAG
ncbi:MAG: ribonuclease HIII, partial [Turicibacter sp.]